MVHDIYLKATYNDTLPKSSYPHYGKKVTEIVYHGTRKREGHDTKESWDKENEMTLRNIKNYEEDSDSAKGLLKVIYL